METTFKKLDAEKLQRVAEVLKTIAHPVRLSILEMLSEKDRLTVSEIQESTQIEQSLLSHNLIKMKDKGILCAKRDGKNIYYSLADRHILNIFECMDSCSII